MKGIVTSKAFTVGKNSVWNFALVKYDLVIPNRHSDTDKFGSEEDFEAKNTAIKGLQYKNRR